MTERTTTEPQPRRVDYEQLIRIVKVRPLKANRVLAWRDEWRKRDRIIRWTGPCLGCGRQTWSFDDGENDPRGALGDNASWPVDFPDIDIEIDVRCCSLCANKEPCYRAVQQAAKRIGIAKARPYNQRESK